MQLAHKRREVLKLIIRMMTKLLTSMRSEKEMASILGGSTDICRELIGEGNAHGEDSDYDWDSWADLVEEYC